MFRFHEIRDRILAIRLPADTKARIGHLIRASESPLGFTAIAGFGLAVLMVGHLLLRTPDTAPDEEPNVPDVATQMPPSVEGYAQVEEDAPPPAPTEKQYSLKRNETLIGLLQRADIPSVTAHRMVANLRDVTNLRKLQRGQEVRITTDADGNVEELRMRDSFDAEAVVYAKGDSFKAERQDITTISLTHLVEGEITDSLYLSAQRAGLPTKVIVDLIRLMSFDVDFEREIRTGDTFQVYFERQYAPDFGDMQEGQLLQVKLGLRKRMLEANYFIDAAGDADYFDGEGKSTRKALMKTPLDVTVVTSNYGRRKHPVLGYTRMHKGVDFRARTGTPIMAAGDGVVERASRYGSYGNYIRIRHNGTYKTAYAHLSRYGKGIKSGARVKQGQVIGYAGATGRVSAAHLHYEVMMNDKQVNPLTLDLPTGRELRGTDLEVFASQRTQLLADILQIQTQRSYIMQAGALGPAPNTLDDAAQVQGTDR
ncbi:peptidoglycan DD-metalloendopeptidase family protein [Kordiimonas sp.]|uniref:peptidoglycan DD-metalloendopeptidase family protein n=1 Tax=Kordiimonas sp. TaxID=1970157 RepID=UPI003B516DE6